MAKNRREPCPGGVEDACPIPRYRCREAGEPGKHCFELFAEFEAFVLPDVGDDAASRRDAKGLSRPDDEEPATDEVMKAVLRQLGNKPSP